jgi:glutaconate CoA-transferase subunit B
VRSTEDDRRRTRLLTDLGMFTVGPGGAILEAIAAHTSLATISARTGFAFTVADALTTLPDPPPGALAAIRALDPDDLRADLVGHPS